MLGNKRKIEELRQAWKEEHLQLLEAKAVINELKEENQGLRESHRSAWDMCSKYKIELEELIEINRSMEEQINDGTDICREV